MRSRKYQLALFSAAALFAASGVVRGQQVPIYSDPTEQSAGSADQEVGPSSVGCEAAVGEGCECCDCPIWEHHNYIFGEGLYLHATGVDMAHAIQQNGSGGQGTAPAGHVGVVDPNYKPGFRVGLGVALDSCSSLSGAYTHFESHASDRLTAPANLVGGNVTSLVLFPGTINAGSTSAQISATDDINFQFADVNYSRLMTGCKQFALNYDLGIRYANLRQGFSQTGDFAQAVGTIRTTTDIDFNGVGMRTGMDGRLRMGDGNWSFYGQGFISILFGEFNSSYSQVNTTTTTTQASSNWADERPVPILEYETGLSWTSSNCHWQFTTGYYTAFWFNTIATPEYIQAVQNSNFAHVHQTIAFDGLVSHVEFRW